MGDVIVPPTFKELKFERYADISLGAALSYTPTTPGLYHATLQDRTYLRGWYYSDTAIGWFIIADAIGEKVVGISDGTNFRLKNTYTTSLYFVLFRMGYSTPNPSPKVGKQILYGKPSIVLESDEKGFIWIEEEELLKLLADIKADVEDKMGYGKYKSLLRGLGYDV